MLGVLGVLEEMISAEENEAEGDEESREVVELEIGEKCLDSARCL